MRTNQRKDPQGEEMTTGKGRRANGKKTRYWLSDAVALKEGGTEVGGAGRVVQEIFDTLPKERIEKK